MIHGMGTLLVNEEEAREFCRKVLLRYKCPRLVQCMARKKYSEGQLQSQMLILERTILHFDKGQESEDDFIRELRKYEILANAGMYRDKKKTGKQLQLSWMVVYITAYPLDEDDAADGFVDKVLEKRKEQRKSLAKVDRKNNGGVVPSMTRNISIVRTQLHTHPSKKWKMLKLDVDTKDPVLLQQLQDSMKGGTVVVAAETRGGYHVVLEKGPCCQGLYKFVMRVNGGVPHEDQWITIENNDGPMFAVPGTNQGVSN